MLFGLFITWISTYLIPQQIDDGKYYNDNDCSTCNEIKNTRLLYIITGFFALFYIIPYFSGSFFGFRNPIYLVFSLIGIIFTIGGFFGFNGYLEDRKCGDSVYFSSLKS